MLTNQGAEKCGCTALSVQGAHLFMAAQACISPEPSGRPGPPRAAAWQPSRRATAPHSPACSSSSPSAARASGATVLPPPAPAPAVGSRGGGGGITARSARRSITFRVRATGGADIVAGGSSGCSDGRRAPGHEDARSTRSPCQLPRLAGGGSAQDSARSQVPPSAAPANGSAHCFANGLWRPGGGVGLARGSRPRMRRPRAAVAGNDDRAGARARRCARVHDQRDFGDAGRGRCSARRAGLGARGCGDHAGHARCADVHALGGALLDARASGAQRALARTLLTKHARSRHALDGTLAAVRCAAVSRALDRAPRGVRRCDV